MEYGFGEVLAASAFVKPYSRKLYALRLRFHGLKLRGDRPLPAKARLAVSSELSALISQTLLLQDMLQRAAPASDPTEKVFCLQQSVAELIDAAEGLEARAPIWDAAKTTGGVSVSQQMIERPGPRVRGPVAARPATKASRFTKSSRGQLVPAGSSGRTDVPPRLSGRYLQDHVTD